MSEVNTNQDRPQEDNQSPGIPENQNESTSLPINTIGNILGEELMHRAAQQAISIVNRTDAAEHEIFSLPFHIQNFNWEQFCLEHPANINVVGANFEQELTEDQILLSETNSYPDRTRVIISDPNHLIPHITNADTFEFKTNSSKQVNQKGVLLIQRKGNMGILTYLSFLPGKKIYGLFIVPEGETIKQFYHVGCVSTDELIPNISLPGEFSPRNVNSNLSEEDKIIIANSSPRLKKKSESLSTLRLALDYFNGLMEQTIDSAYINKLMILNKTLSFPNN